MATPTEQYIIGVVPLVTIPRSEAQILSYYADSLPTVGALVEVPFRSRQVPAIVLEAQPLAQAKRMLKKDFSFNLRYAGKLLSPTPVLNEKQQTLALWLASKYYAPLGASFKTVLPPFVEKKGYLPRSSAEGGWYRGPVVEKAVAATSFISIDNPTEHYKNYLAPIKTNKNKQVLLLVPETTHLDYFAERLAQLKPEVLHSGINNKKYYEIYQKVLSGEPLLLVSTRIGCFLPWQNLGLIILDHESNYAYRSDTTPKYFTPDLAREIVKIYGANLIISDILPRLETVQELSLTSRLLTSRLNLEGLGFTLVNMVDEIKSANFSIFSRELQAKILAAIEKQQKIVLFVPRKGYAPYLLCNSCGHIERCQKCESVLVVHNKSKLRCHHCDNIQPIVNTCPNCKRAILEYKGLGIQKAAEKLNAWLKLNYSTPPLQLELSNDTAPDRKTADQILAEFSTDGAKILFTTQKIFSYLYPGTGLSKVDLIGILNADTLNSFVDFRADEAALQELVTLIKISGETIIQSYHPDSPPLKALAVNRIAEFMAEELANRKILGYPPFGELVKLTYRHRDARTAEREARILKERLNYELGIRNYGKELQILGPNSGQKEKGLYARELILKSKLEVRRRNELLRLLTRGWQAEVL